MTAPEMALEQQHRANAGDLYMSLELGDKHWGLTFGNGRAGPSRCTVPAGDISAMLQRIAKARQRFSMDEDAVVHSCYEAGRDGWWLHRALREAGIDNIVVDSASIEINRRARRTKTDRLDGDKLLSMLQRWHGGETRVWSVLREPTVDQEDERRLHRELQRMTGERTAHVNRIRALLVLHNLRPRHIAGREWDMWWADHREEIPPSLRSEIERELARLALVKQQMRELEAAQARQVAQGKEPQVAQLLKLRAIGLQTGWVLVKELFGWRHFTNRREVAAYLGLVPTPYCSGDSQVEQGISKAGNHRARSLLVEVAWGWLRWQPDSELTQWFNRRFASGGKRTRRIGIVALARRLGIVLWRYVEHGVIPAGAVFKPTT